jgi:diguanylate cyclase (GGDEF)-like protein
MILHLIINQEILIKGGKTPKDSPYYRYRQFIIAILIFYIADIMWGFLAEAKIFAAAYIDTMLFFGMMALSVLLWTRFVAAFLGRNNMGSTILVMTGWGILGFVILNLIINFFYPIIFMFTDEIEYIPGYGRHFLMGAQLILFLALSVYSLLISRKTSGGEKVRYRAVCLSGAVMALLIILQVRDAFAPFYTIGCLIANCLVHVFVEEYEKDKLVRISKQATENKITFTQIAESLASNYDVIYYVAIKDDKYVEFTSRNIYGGLKIKESGDDFFQEVRHNIPYVIYPQDCQMVEDALDKDAILTALEGRKLYVLEYRLIVETKVQYTRLTVRKTRENSHLIICVENIDDEVKREREFAKALSTEKELARRDELTGVKNKTAFAELEQSIQSNINNGLDYLPFALAVCDINDLKKVNDTEGHKAGDELIRQSAKLLCNIFAHSPVFRIGGDEFAIFLSGNDFMVKEQLMDKLQKEILENRQRKNGPVIAVGMSEFVPGTDNSEAAVFERADSQMYENKRILKQQQ